VRRTRVWRIALVLALLAGLATAPLLARSPVPKRRVCAADALQAKAVAGLANFAGWLRRHQTTGFIGEVGWPSNRDSPQWNALASVWYQAADQLNLPVTAWAAGDWPADYPMAIYRPARRQSDVDIAGPQAAIVERHLRLPHHPAGDLRGVALAAGSFAAGDVNGAFGSGSPGVYGQDYTYETAATYRYLAARGMRLIRLAVTWERLQPVPFGPLSVGEVERVGRALDRAGQAGLSVVLDLHGYGDYAAGGGRYGPLRRVTLGSRELPTTALADVWRRIAVAYAHRPMIVAYGVLNEPTRLASDGRAGALLWERASQQAVDAIRAAGADTAVTISGYLPMGPPAWGQMHPRAWIRDPLNRIAYESHAYFDGDGSGHYWAGYAEELRNLGPSRVARCRWLLPIGPSALSPPAPTPAWPIRR
jgi:hypothetical protein